MEATRCSCFLLSQKLVSGRDAMIQFPQAVSQLLDMEGTRRCTFLLRCAGKIYPSNRICVSFPQGAEFLLGNLTRGPIRTFCWGPGRFKYIFWGSGILRDEEGRIWVFGMEGLEINRLGTFPTENVGEGFAQGIRLMPHPPHWSLVHPRQENMP
jgi:hypothetical protein